MPNQVEDGVYHTWKVAIELAEFKLVKARTKLARAQKEFDELMACPPNDYLVRFQDE